MGPWFQGTSIPREGNLGRARIANRQLFCRGTCRVAPTDDTSSAASPPASPPHPGCIVVGQLPKRPQAPASSASSHSAPSTLPCLGRLWWGASSLVFPRAAAGTPRSRVPGQDRRTAHLALDESRREPIVGPRLCRPGDHVQAFAAGPVSSSAARSRQASHSRSPGPVAFRDRPQPGHGRSFGQPGRRRSTTPGRALIGSSYPPSANNFARGRLDEAYTPSTLRPICRHPDEGRRARSRFQNAGPANKRPEPS